MFTLGLVSLLLALSIGNALGDDQIHFGGTRKVGRNILASRGRISLDNLKELSDQQTTVAGNKQTEEFKIQQNQLQQDYADERQEEIGCDIRDATFKCCTDNCNTICCGDLLTFFADCFRQCINNDIIWDCEEPCPLYQCSDYF